MSGVQHSAKGPANWPTRTEQPQVHTAADQGAQPVRGCNPLSADNIRPIIPEQARWISDFLFRCFADGSDPFIQTLKLLGSDEERVKWRVPLV